MKEQMEEEKAVIDRERAIAEGRDAEAKEEEVGSLLLPLMCFNFNPIRPPASANLYLLLWSSRISVSSGSHYAVLLWLCTVRLLRRLSLYSHDLIVCCLVKSMTACQITSSVLIDNQNDRHAAKLTSCACTTQQGIAIGIGILLLCESLRLARKWTSRLTPCSCAVPL